MIPMAMVNMYKLSIYPPSDLMINTNDNNNVKLMINNIITYDKQHHHT